MTQTKEAEASCGHTMRLLNMSDTAVESAKKSIAKGPCPDCAGVFGNFVQRQSLRTARPEFVASVKRQPNVPTA